MKIFDNIRVKDFEPASTEAVTTVDMSTAIWSDESHPSSDWF